MRPRTRGVCAIATLAGSLWLVWWTGVALDIPLWSMDDPSTMAVCLLRIVMMAATAYLLLAAGLIAFTNLRLAVPSVVYWLCVGSAALPAGPAAADDVPAGEVATMTRVDIAPAPPTTSPGPAIPDVAEPSLPSPEPETWEVRPGDSFWSIAEEIVGDGAQDIDAYWRTLIAANDDRLIAPGNPDLLLPGQVLVLPPL